MNHRRRSTSPWFLLAAVVVVCGAVVFATRHAAGARHLAGSLGSLDARFVAMGVVCSGLAIVNRGLLNRAAHRAVGIDAEAAAMTRTAAIGFAAQKLVKSAGAVGLAVFVREGRRRGHAPGEVAAACVLSAIASFVALGVLLVTAIVVLAASGRLTGWWIAAAIGFGLYACAVLVVGLVVARSRPAAVRLWTVGHRIRGRMSRRDVGPVDVTIPNQLFDALGTLRGRGSDIRALLAHGVASKVLGALMLATAVSAVGVPVGSAEAIVIYATALAASMVTIVPGGVGTVEGSTTALLVASGAALAPATLAVVLFRCFDLLMPVGAGALAARGRLRPVGEQVDTEPVACGEMADRADVPGAAGVAGAAERVGAGGTPDLASGGAVGVGHGIATRPVIVAAA